MNTQPYKASKFLRAFDLPHPIPTSPTSVINQSLVMHLKDLAEGAPLVSTASLKKKVTDRILKAHF